METFEEMMEKFRSPGDEPLPPTFADDLAKVHAEELSIRDAAVKAREAANAAIMETLNAEKAETIRLKAVNYDLMMSAPKAGEPEKQEPGNDDAGDTPRGIASLFVKEND